MLEPRDRLRFAQKSSTRVRVARKMLEQYLDGDCAAEPRVASFVDLAHPAGADERDNLVVTQAFASRERHVVGDLDHAKGGRHSATALGASCRVARTR